MRLTITGKPDTINSRWMSFSTAIQRFSQRQLTFWPLSARRAQRSPFRFRIVPGSDF